MGIKKTPDNQESKPERPKFNFATLGTIFPTKKEGRGSFKPKTGQYGVKSIEVTLNNGDIYELDENMFIMVNDKSIKTKNGAMDIKEVVLGY